jgi:microcystin degradation protein MlrC
MSNNRRSLRVFVTGIAHETNSFSPLPTALRNFEADCAYRPSTGAAREEALAFPGYGDAVRIAAARGDRVIEGPFFWSQPSGPAPAPTYAQLRGEILDALREAGPVDMVMLVLHGAMMAEGTLDCEGDILNAVRALVGPQTPVGAVLDLHGNVGPAMIESGAILVGVKEYPHIDYAERSAELHEMLADMAHGARLTTTLRTIPELSLQGTTEEPMRGFVETLQAAEGHDGVRSVTLMHGFPWSDWELTGASVLIVSQDAEPQAVDRLADELADRFTRIVASAPVERLSVGAAIDAALALPAGKGPVVISDSSDNAGGGAASDSSFLLRELIERDCQQVAIGMIWDPQVAQIAADAGVGAKLRLRIGGKVGPLSGDPVDVEAEVLAVRPDVCQRFFRDTPNRALGLAVGLRVGGVEIVVNSIRQQVFAPECFTELGIDVASKALVVVKSSQHFRACFDPIARATLYCNAPGSLNVDLAQMPYRRLTLAGSQAPFTIDRPVQRARCTSPAMGLVES